jgi:hypothetical protein
MMMVGVSSYADTRELICTVRASIVSYAVILCIYCSELNFKLTSFYKHLPKPKATDAVESRPEHYMVLLSCFT